MRPAIAKRVTMCSFCKQDIEIGSQRLDDVVMIGKDGAGKTMYSRLHFHPKCFLEKNDAWFERHKDDEYSGEHGGGHPPSNLTPEQREDRRKILSKLANLIRYWIPRLNLSIPAEQLTEPELRQFNLFALRLAIHREALRYLGGMPKRYLEIGIPPSVDAVIQKIVTPELIPANSELVSTVS